MMPLAIADPAVQEFVKRLMQAAASATSPADAATKSMTVLGIPEAIRGGKDEAELTRIGLGLKALKLPAPQLLGDGLATVKAAHIPLQVIEGGWSPAFAAVAKRVADLGGGTHVVMTSPHHFPQLSADDFNPALIAFMIDADRARTKAG